MRRRMDGGCELEVVRDEMRSEWIDGGCIGKICEVVFREAMIVDEDWCGDQCVVVSWSSYH